MKISPIAASQGMNTVSHGAVEIGRTASPEKLEIAKAIARGEARPEKTPTVDPQIARTQNTLNKIKMKTQVSPDRAFDAESASTESLEGSAPANENKESAEPAEETKPLSPQLAEIAKQRRALQVKEREIAEREKALSLKTSAPEAPNVMTRLKTDPLSVLQEAGVTYDQLTEAILGQTPQKPASPEIEALRAEIKALKEGVDKTLTDKDVQAKQAVLTEMRREANRLAKEGETFEVVRETGSIEDVMSLIERTFDETGEVLEVSEAMRLVEDELLKEIDRIATIKKAKSRFQPPVIETAPQSQPQKIIKTLTNRDGVTPQLGRRERAMAAFYGTLKR